MKAEAKGEEQRIGVPLRVISGRPGGLFGMSEEHLGENVRDACTALGWRFLWLRKTQHSSAGILDLLLIPVRGLHPNGHRRVLHRELKGYDRNGRLGTLTTEQAITIESINAAGGDARKWEPADWTSGQILEELK